MVLMFTNKFEIFEIIDIIRLKRNNVELNTINKACYCLSCRLNGESLFFYNNESLIAKRGDLLYIPKNCTYSQKTEGEEIVCFHLQAYRGSFSELTISANNFSDKICSLFDKAEILWQQKKDNYYYDCLSILYKILSICNLNFSSNIKITNPLKSL